MHIEVKVKEQKVVTFKPGDIFSYKNQYYIATDLVPPGKTVEEARIAVGLTDGIAKEFNPTMDVKKAKKASLDVEF